MASLNPPNEENIIEFNIGEFGVANTGGSIALKCNGIKCRLDVPPGIPLGTLIRINCTAAENTTETSSIGMNTLQDFHQPDTTLHKAFEAQNVSLKPKTKEKKNWNGALSAEQQLVLASIIIGVVGLGVGVGILSQNTTLWEKPGVGASILLAIIFAALIASIESGFSNILQLPLIESVSSIVSTFIIFSLYLSIEGYVALWVLGIGFVFTSLFHTFHVKMTHKKYDIITPSSWFSTRLVLLFTPFVFLWFGIILSFGWAESSKPFLLMAAAGAYVLVGVGTLAPTMMYLDCENMVVPPNYLQYFSQQENTLLLWVLLNGLTVCLLALKGGARLHAPIAQLIPASAFFIAVASPLIPAYPSPPDASTPTILFNFKLHRPRGIASIILALFCLVICIGSRAVAGSVEPSAALASFGALLIGTISHHVIEAEDLETARESLAGILLVCSFWTGRYTSVFTESFACLIWGSLQLPLWHDLIDSRKDQTENQKKTLENNNNGGGRLAKRMSLNPMQLKPGETNTTILNLRWYEKSLEPSLFLTGMILCMSSFVLTDWIDRYYNASAGFLMARGIFSITIPPLVAAIANERRSVKDVLTTGDGDCILIAITVPFIAGFASSGPWYENTKYTSIIYSFFILVSIRLTNNGEIWSSRDINMNPKYLDFAVYILFFTLCVSTFSNYLFDVQNWVVTLLAFLFAGPEGVLFKDAYTRIAMFRPPILGSLILFLFAILTDGYRARNADDDMGDTFLTVLPLLLLLPLFFISCGIGGRVYSNVTLNNLRLDIALASIYFAICAAPFAGFVVGPDVEYNYKKNSSDDLKSSFLPNSAWVLMAVLMVAMIGEFLLLKLTPNPMKQSSRSLVTSSNQNNGGAPAASAADDEEEGDVKSLVDHGKSSSSSSTSTFQSLPTSNSSAQLQQSQQNDNDDNDEEEEDLAFNGRDTLVSGGISFIGAMSVEMPLALVMGTMFGVVWARERRSFHGAVLATFIFLCRGVLQLFNNLYGFSTEFWLLMYGCFMLFLVALWPMPELLGGSNMGAGAALLRVGFVAAAVMMVGPATDGWGSLAAIIFFTAVYVKSTESGVLRAAVFTPLLYFGSFAMIIYPYEEKEYLTYASFITAILSFICAIILRFTAKNENDEAVSHFLVYFIFMPFGLGCTSEDFNYVPLIVSTIVSVWAYCHINKHTSSAVFLVSIIPFIMLTSVATLVRNENKYISRGMLALTAGLWGIKLVIVYFVMKSNGSLDQTIKDNTNAATSTTSTSNKNDSDESKNSFNFTNSFGDCMKYVNALGNGCLEQFSACGMLWLLASFVFLDGFPALAFAGLISLFLMLQMFFNNHKWYLLVLICSVAVTVASFEIDIGNGLIWLDGYGATAIVSLVSLPLPWLITYLTPKNNFITLSLAPFIACFVIIPFGFTGSIATKGVLSVVSVFTVIFWTSSTSYYSAIGCSILPNFAIVAGALLRHGGEGPMLVGDKYGSLLPGGSLVACGLYYVIFGTCMSKKQDLLLSIQKQKLNDQETDDIPFYLEWVPPQYMQKCGAFALLLGLCYGISGFIGIVALFLLTIFVGGASMLDKKNAEIDPSSSSDSSSAVVSETGIVNDEEILKKSNLLGGIVKQQFAEVSVYLIFLATAMGVSYAEHCVHGIASTELAAVACVSIGGFVLVLLSTIFDSQAQTIPWHVRDFLMYLWFVMGGLIGAAANDLGSLGVIVIVIGAMYSFYRHHSIICVFVSPCLMFWAGVNLNKFTNNTEPCIAIGTPVLIYAICELIAAQILKLTSKDVILKGPGAIPLSWANPKEIVPRYFSSSLEISGALFLIAGSMGLMYCPGDKGGSLGIGGQLAFICLLVIMGIYLLRNGLMLRDEQEVSNATNGENNGGIVPIKTQGLRLRVAGLLLMNAAIWFALPLTSSVALKAIVIVLGSMVLIISGCASMYWKRDVDAQAIANNKLAMDNARNETIENANAL
jgi:hypothetical protein